MTEPAPAPAGDAAHHYEKDGLANPRFGVRSPSNSGTNEQPAHKKPRHSADSASSNDSQSSAGSALSAELRTLLNQVAREWSGTKAAATKLASSRPLSHPANIEDICKLMRGVRSFRYIASADHREDFPQLKPFNLADFPPDSPVWEELGREIGVQDDWTATHKIVRWCVSCCRAPRTSHNKTEPTYPTQAATLRKNFYDTEYLGQKHQVLADLIEKYEGLIQESWALRDNAREAPWYGRILPIMQSSGMGKSRLVRQLSKVGGFSVFMFCLRQSEGDQKGCYPKADVDVRDFFTEPCTPGCESEIYRKNADGQDHLAALKSHSLFQAFYEEVAGMDRKGQDWNDVCDPSVPEKEDKRRQFVRKIVDHAKILLEDRISAYPYDPSTEAGHTAKSALAVSKACAQVELQEDEYFVVAIDEARGILPPHMVGENATSRAVDDAVRRCLKPISKLFAKPGEKDQEAGFCARERFWILFADTSLAISTLQGPRDQDPSFRIATEELERLPGHCPISLNVSLSGNKMALRRLHFELSPLQLCTDPVLARQGRPLWASMLEVVQPDAADTSGTEVDHFERAETRVRCYADPFFCLSKLLTPPTKGKWTLEPSQLLALLHARLDINPTTDIHLNSVRAWDIVALQRQRVHKHLGVLVKLHLWGKLVKVMTANEALLTKAVTAFFRTKGCDRKGQRLLKDPGGVWTPLLQYLKTEVMAGLPLDQGELGELAAQIIMCLCHDYASRREATGATGSEEGWQKRCQEAYNGSSAYVHVVDFFKLLMNDVSADFAASFGDFAWVNFERFSRAPEGFELTREGLQQAFLERCAIVGRKNQSGWDFVFPVYCGNLKEALSPHAWTYVLVQVKNRTSNEAGDLKPVKMTHGHLLWPDEKAQASDPYIPRHPPIMLRLELGKWKKIPAEYVTNGKGPTPLKVSYSPPGYLKPQDRSARLAQPGQPAEATVAKETPYYWSIRFGSFDARHHPILKHHPITKFPHHAPDDSPQEDELAFFASDAQMADLERRGMTLKGAV